MLREQISRQQENMLRAILEIDAQSVDIAPAMLKRTAECLHNKRRRALERMLPRTHAALAEQFAIVARDYFRENASARPLHADALEFLAYLRGRQKLSFASALELIQLRLRRGDRFATLCINSRLICGVRLGRWQRVFTLTLGRSRR